VASTSSEALGNNSHHHADAVDVTALKPGHAQNTVDRQLRQVFAISLDSRQAFFGYGCNQFSMNEQRRR
jgi:hypothetical protein